MTTPAKARAVACREPGRPAPNVLRRCRFGMRLADRDQSRPTAMAPLTPSTRRRARAARACARSHSGRLEGMLGADMLAPYRAWASAGNVQRSDRTDVRPRWRGPTVMAAAVREWAVYAGFAPTKTPQQHGWPLVAPGGRGCVLHDGVAWAEANFGTVIEFEPDFAETTSSTSTVSVVCMPGAPGSMWPSMPAASLRTSRARHPDPRAGPPGCSREQP